MYSLLLVIIYIAFISLGLPDSLIGSGWPVMQRELGVPLSYAGIITMVISMGTILSSLLSDRLTKRFGTGVVTAVSVFTTAFALFGFSISNSFYLLLLWAIPYGFGAGAVDAALNNYVALHYTSRHMNWLHSFWGVGASISPYIMSSYLTQSVGWQGGYRAVSIIQVVLAALIFMSLPIWKKRANGSAAKIHEPLGLSATLRLKGIIYALLTFFCYSAIEMTTGLWASSYLVEARGVDVETAAYFASLFYMGIMFGRFLSGIVADRFTDKQLMRIGMVVLSVGILCIALPLATNTLTLAGLLIVGLGCAPIYPAIIHSTPAHFGVENSQAAIGVQMAAAYTGTTLMPPVFGFLATHISIGIFPAYLAVFALIMIIMSEQLHKVKNSSFSQ